LGQLREIIYLVIFGIIWLSFNVSAEVLLKPRSQPAKWNECQNCHREKNFEHIQGIKKPKKNHQSIEIVHGSKEMSCSFCHNKNNHNFLFSAQQDNDFTHTSRVCQTCHSDVYKKWYEGAHGKRIDSWLHQSQLQCIECHNPHNVTFPKMKADPPPKRPRLLIPKHKESD
jgi:hypothetical protein